LKLNWLRPARKSDIDFKIRIASASTGTFLGFAWEYAATADNRTKHTPTNDKNFLLTICASRSNRPPLVSRYSWIPFYQRTLAVLAVISYRTTRSCFRRLKLRVRDFCPGDIKWKRSCEARISSSWLRFWLAVWRPRESPRRRFRGASAALEIFNRR
jgi:hypothetical protein